MDEAELVERLAAQPGLGGIPRAELAWLAAHGTLELYGPGGAVARRGDPADRLLIVLSGKVPIHIDRGSGPRWVIDWHSGDVTGLLPYSRLTHAGDDIRVDEDTAILAVHARHFPEMIRECPAFIEHTVHLMLDRARRFHASDLQEEKMISLGRLAAGLAHELNNPASAALRGAKLLHAGVAEADSAVRSLTETPFTAAQLEAMVRLSAAVLATPADPVRSPIERADREEEYADWLARHDSDPRLADPLAESCLELATLDDVASRLPGDSLGGVLRWIAWVSSTRALAADVERAAVRISDVVDAVKRFTYMDNRAGPEVTHIEAGLRDTLAVLAAKVSLKDAVIALDVEPDLPAVRASGGDLNQVWLHLVDNALDAIETAGRVEISARRELNRVTVRVIDDGPGIPPETMPRIFDPFFTTKEPGQGTGLGLEIARRLVRRCRGEITAESNPGRTEFRVSLEGIGATAGTGPAETGTGEY